MKALVLIFWTVAVAVAANGWTAAGEDDLGAAVKKELKKLAGTWHYVAYEKDGVKGSQAEQGLPNDLTQIKVIVNGDKLTMQVAGKTMQEGWICIDPTRKLKVIDFYATKPEGKVEMGIYEWDGDDQLKVCFTDPGTEQTRPRLFSTTKGTGHVLAVVKREKAK
jgi:uncharacterized protein (TIGR03067 family)